VIYPDSSIEVSVGAGVTTGANDFEMLLSTPVTTGAQNTVFLIDAVCNAICHGGVFPPNIRYQLKVDDVEIRTGRVSGFDNDQQPCTFMFSERVEVPTLGEHVVDFLWCCESPGDKATTTEFASLRVRGVVR
jgi:hypothetical protein